MRSLSWFALMLVCSVLVSGQNASPTLSEAQRSLKRLLDKDAPYVSSVKFDGCRLSIRSVSRQSYWSGSRPSSTVAGSFPRDDSANYLSGGGDQLIFEGRSSVYEFDLAKLDASKLLIGPISKKGLASITIEDEPAGLMVAKKPDAMLTMFQPGRYIIVTKKKSVERTVQAFQDLAEACSAAEK